MQALSSSEFKTCCTSVYENKLLQFLLGPSLHPGGLGLSRRLAQELAVSSDDLILDVASGLGETARLLTLEFGCRVYGLELSKSLVKEATSSLGKLSVDFTNGDAEHLPFKAGSVDVVVSECSMCLLPGLEKGLTEAFRVLRQGGRLGLTDMATRGPLHPELEQVLMSFLCLSNKTRPSEYEVLLRATGFRHVASFDETDSLRGLLEGIRKRLLLAEVLRGVGKLTIPEEQLAQGKRLLTLAEEAVDQGVLSYVMLTASKPGS